LQHQIRHKPSVLDHLTGGVIVRPVGHRHLDARLFERALGSVIGAGATVADDSVSGRHGDRE
jgi:hypothetical protein